MNRIDQVVNILEKLNHHTMTEDIRKEALEIVSNIDPLELSMAEQKLIENGMKPEDLRHLCDIHMEVLKGELEKLKTQVHEGHILDTMVAEHEKILEFLKELEGLNNRIQQLEVYERNLDVFEQLMAISDNILAAEKHHQREEDVLFMEMEKRAITGPTRIMRMEHDDLRARKKLMKDLSIHVGDMAFDDFKSKLDETAKYIIFHLRDHIFKENYILYPTALKAIDNEEIWDNMKKACDEIGYCSFTFTK